MLLIFISSNRYISLVILDEEMNYHRLVKSDGESILVVETPRWGNTRVIRGNQYERCCL